MKIAVSYVKNWCPSDGTLYTQRIKIDVDTFNKLNDAIRSEIALKYPRKAEYIFTSGYEPFLKLLPNTEGLCFMNSTQTRFVNLFLKQRLFHDRNTCLRIIK